jgi:phosphoglycerol transferase MdoB-like AlkP superfamily enzyme
MVDLELYRHWGFRLDNTPLFYLRGTGTEALGSVAISVAIKLLFILLALGTISIFVYSVWLAPQLDRLRPPQKRKSAVVLLILTALMFIPIRGSFTVAPMNTGFVYFHPSKPFANHAAINVVWNFLYELQRSEKSEYTTKLFDRHQAEVYFDSLYTTSDSTAHLFAAAKPNIVLFVLESFTSNVIEPLGGVEGLTPNLNQLCREGILFDNFYASGDRTDKGIVSVLSGYPAQPQSSIIKYPSKTQKLPSLNQLMRQHGYGTSFIYGGDIDFANFRSYLTLSGFEHVTTASDFPAELNKSKWGVHDHIVFERASQECDTAQAPFFKVVLSLSSHEPFDVPMTPFIKGTDEKSLFLNACHYTDKSIGEFINRAKQQPWWTNTVLIFVADHGHRLPENHSIEKKERFKIPLLMVGGAIQKDTVIHTYGSQTDLANTVLGQIGKTSSEFKFSRNLLTPSPKSFAAYFFKDGFGFVSPTAYVVYDNDGKQFLQNTGTKRDLDVGKAYEQILYLDYNAK